MEKGLTNKIDPQVDGIAEFFEILNDFGEPLEIVREAISNSYDANATRLDITLSVEDYEGDERLFIRFKDDGQGMDRETLRTYFWGLGFSRAREEKKEAGKLKIGEKGHGTKIFLNSERVEVRTQTKDGAVYSYCDRPKASLSKRKLHEPFMEDSD